MTGGIEILTGLAGSGKTSSLINEMRRHQDEGGEVRLFLSSEHEELTNRRNVVEGGLMGCRTPNLSFPIDHVCTTSEAEQVLAGLGDNAVAVFDEAQFFQPGIVTAWGNAASRGVRILAASLSPTQLDLVKRHAHRKIQIEIPCSECSNEAATDVVYSEDLTYPKHVCGACNVAINERALADLLRTVIENEPFPGEKKTYQPFYDVDQKGWELVRGDSPARLNIILDAVQRSVGVRQLLDDSVTQPSYLDLGCCSGFFSDAMTTAGFRSTGVDVTKHFIDWASRLARIKGQAVNLVCQDARTFMDEADGFDVISTFATIQWVMQQNDYDEGLSCLKQVFDKARHVAVVEMGYTTEEIYKNRIKGLQEPIDRHWVLKMMQQHGDFAAIEVHHSGENGIWRDVFVGFRGVPTLCPFRAPFTNEAVSQISNVKQHWEDGWAGPAFSVYWQAHIEITTLSLKGWFPEQLAVPFADESPVLSIYHDGKVAATVDVRPGEFEIQCEFGVPRGGLFSLTTKSDAEYRPDGDDRVLAFVLTELSFK